MNIQPGMTVAAGTSSPSTWRGEVLAIDDNSAWVRWTDPENGVTSPVRSTLALSALRVQCTLRDQLREAFPDHIERIEKYADEGVLNIPAEWNAGQALSMAFSWGRTDEGHEYWRDLAKSAGWGS